MTHALTVFLFTFGLFLGMLLFLEIGRRIAVRRVREDTGAAGEGVGAVDGAVFALLGLLIAFTFSGASSRFDTRRQLIVEETNDIGTAYLRLDLLPADLQPALRDSFRRYLDARIEVYRKLPDIAAAKESLAKANELQNTNLAPGDCCQPGGRRSACSADTTAPCAERDDRYHDDPNHGDPDASADDRFRDAFRIGAGSVATGGLWHDRQQGAPLVPYAWLRAGHGVRCVRHTGYRVSTLGFDSSGRFRPSFGRPAREHESLGSRKRVETMSKQSRVISFVKSIFHPSDFSEASELAFAHALAIALIGETELVIMHARRGEREDWSQFPAVRKTLARWQVLEPGSLPSEIFQKLAVRITKVSTRGDPVRASMRQIEKQKPDLVVLATRGRHGLPLWIKPSVAQAIAHRTSAMTLFVPRGCRGIVSLGGVINLHRILLPVDHKPDPREVAVRATRAAEALGDECVEIVLLHVNGTEFPQFDRPEGKDWVWKELRRDGDVVAAILDAAEEADLIVMATEGEQGIIDALRGSVTERVVRDAPCPVLAVPARKIE